MGRSPRPCCDELGLTKGHWTPEEDSKLEDYIVKHGHGNWKALPKLAGLNRCGKSCRLRWTNYLRPDIKRGAFTEEEEEQIIELHAVLGNKWSAIAAKLPGRTDNEIKNYWNTHLRKKLLQMGIDPVNHQPRADLTLLASIPGLLASLGCGLRLAYPLDNALRLQADDVARLANIQLIQCLVQLLSPATNSSTTTSGLLLLQQQQLVNNHAPPSDHQNRNQFQDHGKSSSTRDHHLDLLDDHQQMLHAPTTTSSSSLSDMGGTADVDPSRFLQNFPNYECSPAVNWVEGGDHHIMPQVFDGSLPINSDQFGYDNIGTSRSSCSNPTSNSTPFLNHDNFSADPMQDYYYLQSFHGSTTSPTNVDFHHWNEGPLPQSSSALQTWPGAAAHKGGQS